MNPSDFDWDLIRSFLAVLDQGSLMGAARVLSASQPTVGRHIAELECQLNVALFERTGRGLVPTETALRLAESARGMETSALELAQTLSKAKTQTRGTVRITASARFATTVMPTVLAKMRQALPEIQVELVASNAVSNLLRREADIAVRMMRPDQTSLVAKKIGSVVIGAFAHKNYLALHMPLRSPADLMRHALIGGDTDTTILEGFKAMGYAITRESFVLRCDDYVVQWNAVRAGIGIGFAATYMQNESSDLVRVLPQLLKIPSLPAWLVVHREIRSNPRIRAVYDYLAKALPELI